MSPSAERVLVCDEVFASGIESMEIVPGLERRRALVAEGKGRLLREEDGWERMRASGHEVWLYHR